MTTTLPPTILPDGSTLVRSEVADKGAGTLAIVHNGTYFHLTTMKDPAVLAYQPTWFYIRDLQPGDLVSFTQVVVADRMHPDLLREHAPEFLAVAHNGGTLVVLGANEAETWVPGLSFEDRPVNFWWWRYGEDPGIRPVGSDNPAWQYLSTKAVIWHHHGAFHSEHKVETLVRLEEKIDDAFAEVGAILLEDTTSTPGRIIITSLDPFFHHGSNFMPGSTRFLYGMLRWIDHTS